MPCDKEHEESQPALNNTNCLDQEAKVDFVTIKVKHIKPLLECINRQVTSLLKYDTSHIEAMSVCVANSHSTSNCLGKSPDGVDLQAEKAKLPGLVGGGIIKKNFTTDESTDIVRGGTVERNFTTDESPDLVGGGKIEGNFTTDESPDLVGRGKVEGSFTTDESPDVVGGGTVAGNFTADESDEFSNVIMSTKSPDNSDTITNDRFDCVRCLKIYFTVHNKESCCIHLKIHENQINFSMVDIYGILKEFIGWNRQTKYNRLQQVSNKLLSTPGYAISHFGSCIHKTQNYVPESILFYILLYEKFQKPTEFSHSNICQFLLTHTSKLTLGIVIYQIITIECAYSSYHQSHDTSLPLRKTTADEDTTSIQDRSVRRHKC